jgi:hypothetical protein
MFSITKVQGLATGLLCVIVLIAGVPLESVGQPTELSRQLSFTILPTKEGLPQMVSIYYMVAGEEREVTLGYGRRGNQQTIPATMQSFEIYRKEVDAEGNVTTIPLAEVRLPDDALQCLVVLLRNPSKPWLIDAHVMDDSPAAFPVGSVLFENYYPKEVAVKIAGDAFGLPFRGRRKIELEHSGEGQIRVPFLAAVESDAGWEFKKSGRLAMWPQSRMLIICAPFVRMDETSVFRVHYLQDSVNFR